MQDNVIQGNGLELKRYNENKAPDRKIYELTRANKEKWGAKRCISMKQK